MSMLTPPGMGGKKYRITGDRYPRMRRPRHRRRIVLSLAAAACALGLVGLGDPAAHRRLRRPEQHRARLPGQTEVPGRRRGGRRPGEDRGPQAARARHADRQRLQRHPALRARQAHRRRTAEARLQDRQGGQRPRRLRQEDQGRRDTARPQGSGRRPTEGARHPAHRRPAEDRHPQGRRARPDHRRRLQGAGHPAGRHQVPVPADPSVPGPHAATPSADRTQTGPAPTRGAGPEQ